jgi:hypothetical protein
MLKMRAERHIGLHVKCLLLLPNFNQKLNVSTDYSKTSQYQFHDIPITGYEVVACVQT